MAGTFYGCQARVLTLTEFLFKEMEDGKRA